MAKGRKKNAQDPAAQVAQEAAAFVAAEKDAPAELSQQDAAELFASEVEGTVGSDRASQVAQFDPAWLLLIVQIVIQVATQCVQDHVKTQLQAAKTNSRSLPAELLRLRLTRQLRKRKGWSNDHAQIVAGAIVSVAQNNIDTPLWNAVWNQQPPAT